MSKLMRILAEGNFSEWLSPLRKAENNAGLYHLVLKSRLLVSWPTCQTTKAHTAFRPLTCSRAPPLAWLLGSQLLEL